MSFNGAEADRMISQMIQVGEVVEIAGDGTARVKVGDLVTHPIPVSVGRAGAVRMWSMPSVGEQVLLFCPSGDVSRGIVGPSLAASNAPSGDTAVPMIHLGGGSMKIVGDLKIDGDLHVTGDVTVDGDVIVSGISFLGHVHTDVTPGSSNTGTPAGA